MSCCSRTRLKSTPNDPDALRLLARTSVRQHLDKSARSIYSRLGGASAMKPEDFYLMGVVLTARGTEKRRGNAGRRGS